MKDTRVVKVDKEFYSKLIEYLQPEERWVEDMGGTSVLLLWTYTEDGTRKLQFVRKVEV